MIGERLTGVTGGCPPSHGGHPSQVKVGRFYSGDASICPNAQQGRSREGGHAPSPCRLLHGARFICSGASRREACMDSFLRTQQQSLAFFALPESVCLVRIVGLLFFSISLRRGGRRVACCMSSACNAAVEGSSSSRRHPPGYVEDDDGGVGFFGIDTRRRRPPPAPPHCMHDDA